MAVYGRGSEWRRWDLHVHTPGTALGDQFGDWDGYVAAVEAADPSIAVVGVTDYTTIRTYKTFLEYRAQRRMQNIILILPDIEFRISPETKRGKGINLHLLVSPEDQDHVSRIEEALSRLSLKRADENIPCTGPGLIRLGKLTKLEASSEEAAFAEGVRQFKVEFDQFREWYESEQWLSRNALIAVAGGSSDGASGLTDSGFLATRRELYAFANMIFSANPAERESWLGRGGIPSTEFQVLGVPKPVVHGSDAHSIGQLFRPQKDRYCWIKADPTFEGLRQVVYEPEDRVWIGETPPTTHESRSVLDSISISNANGWFDERSLPLNTGLVAIVGLKGSGKTALTDLIAFAGGAELDPEDSFVSRAGDHIEGLSVSLQWRDGSIEPATIPHEPGGASGLAVRYLSQRFVERLCSGDTLSNELQREVESVIFDHLPIEDRMEAEDFAELRAMRTGGLRQERDNLRNAITRSSRDIAALDQRRSDILKKNKRRSELPKLLDGLKKALPKIDDKAIATKLDELKKVREQKNKVSQSIADLKLIKQQVQDLERRLSAQIKEFASFWAESEKALRKLGFQDEALVTLRPTLPVDPAGAQLSRFATAAFKARYAEIDEQVRKLEGSAATTNAGQTATTSSLDAAIKKLESELKLDDAKKRKVLEIQHQDRALTDEQRKLENEFGWAEKGYKEERQEAQTRRVNSYLSYFELLEEERQVLEELYAPLRTALSNQGAHERKLGMVCRVEVDTDAWIVRGEELFDLRKSGSFRYEDIRNIAKTDLHRAWRGCDRAEIRACLEQCVTLIREAENLRAQLKAGYQPFDVAEWLFGVDHIAVTHGIQYEGKDLRSLSPGSKGIVLMVLYLAVDRSDTRPLIVDQPDENLDNQSTFEILRSYFREAKKRRQVIIITHNPNLVVNTDAEQIIVARSDVQTNGLPHIRYSSGSLEALRAEGPLDCSIREEICRILEGGREAFRMRQQRYGEDSLQ
jgi:ABC-type hemin transport system ATPase subunit